MYAIRSYYVKQPPIASTSQTATIDLTQTDEDTENSKRRRVEKNYFKIQKSLHQQQPAQKSLNLMNRNNFV